MHALMVSDGPTVTLCKLYLFSALIMVVMQIELDETEVPY